MSWLLFLDESGHDHKKMPYEVRGGVAMHAGQLWPFVQAMQRLELECFGGHYWRRKRRPTTSSLHTARRAWRWHAASWSYYGITRRYSLPQRFPAAL